MWCQEVEGIWEVDKTGVNWFCQLVFCGKVPFPQNSVFSQPVLTLTLMYQILCLHDLLFLNSKHNSSSVLTTDGYILRQSPNTILGLKQILTDQILFFSPLSHTK